MGRCNAPPQKIVVFQQNQSAKNKIAGIRRFGGDCYELEIISIDEALPPVIDDGFEYLPRDWQADLVLDYLKHPDLSHDLASLCLQRNIPIVISGKKVKHEGVVNPPT